MASGLPCIVSRIRGNTDLIDEKGGIYIDPTSADSVAGAIKDILLLAPNEMGYYNIRKIKKFANIKVYARMKEIYFE